MRTEESQLGSLAADTFRIIRMSFRECPAPPEGHVFLTVVVKEVGGSGDVPGCLVKLDPLFGEPASVTASTGTSDRTGRIEFVQPHGKYEISAKCPGEVPGSPELAELDSPNLTYAEHEVADRRR